MARDVSCDDSSDDSLCLVMSHLKSDPIDQHHSSILVSSVLLESMVM